MRSRLLPRVCDGHQLVAARWLRSALPRLARPRSACHWHSRACQMELRFGSSVSARMSGYSVHSLSTDIRSLEVKEGVSGAGLFWSPVIEGDTAGVEIFVPAAIEPGNVRFTLGDVSHLVASAMDAEAFQDKSSGWCEVNVACYSSTWGSTAKAVAKIIFTSGGSSYLCTGTLLNDSGSEHLQALFSHGQSLHQHEQRCSDGEQLVVLSVHVRGHLSVSAAALSWSGSAGHEQQQRLYIPAPERTGTKLMSPSPGGQRPIL